MGGMVAASQPLAVGAGLKVLEIGGNAADAAIAAAAALGVCEPYSTGLGGDAFALYYHAAAKTVFALNGSGRAPMQLDLDKLHREGFANRIPDDHPYSVTVPGACAAWCDLVEKFGSLPLASILEPAIQLAGGGFPVSPLTSYYWSLSTENLPKNAHLGEQFTIDGRAPFPGEVFRNPWLAYTMKVIAEKGKAGFYQGEIAEAIVSTLKNLGGCMTLEDIASHQSSWEIPISTRYRNLQVWECPPNGQGLAALLALNLVEGYNLAEMPADSVQRLHLLIEAMKLAFADVRTHVTDGNFYPIPLDQLLSKSYAEQRRKLISPDSANLSFQTGIPASKSDTVYLSVVDREGNACSFINSLYKDFGSGIAPQGLGFALQNRGCNFSLDPNHPNGIAPGKRPYHTIIPAMATNVQGNDLYASFGVMGGFMQPQGHLQVLVGMADDNLDPQSALDRARFCVDGEDLSGWVALEEGIAVDVMAGLSDLGHIIRPVSGTNRSLFGRGQIIRRNPGTGVLWAGSDPRADGCAMSLR